MQTKKISALDIAKAYNKKKKHLIAVESGCCGHKRLVVMNEMVVLRQMLEELGFDNETIDKVLYST